MVRKYLLASLTLVGLGVVPLATPVLAYGPSGKQTASKEKMVVQKPGEQCASMLRAKLPSQDFGLPTGEARIDSAELVAANTENTAPQFCKLTGTIFPAVVTDLPIHFQLNLPTEWNRKALQFGGGGSNGVVITGLANGVHLRSGDPTPLMRGYATYGGDSGHMKSDPNWAKNKQAMSNFAGESVKRTHDAAIGFVKRYYKNAPRRVYFMGGSKGGQEALVAAQRYGADYDGVVSYYPAAAAFAMQMSWGRMGYIPETVPGSRISEAQGKLVRTRLIGSCDGLDGANDGVISNVKACRTTFALESLRCPSDTADHDTCLSDPQIAGLKIAATPLEFDFPLSGGLRSIGPYPILAGADFYSLIYSDALSFVFRGSGEDVAKQISGNPSMKWLQFDYRDFRPQVEARSAEYDVSNVELEQFLAHGGKMLLIQGTVDMLVPEDLTTQYWNRLQQRHGAKLNSFARYYVQPGFGHGDGDFVLSLDSLTLIDRWVEQGNAPDNVIAVDEKPKNNLRTRPLCEYPKWPRYRGTGDINIAASFECVDR